MLLRHRHFVNCEGKLDICLDSFRVQRRSEPLKVIASLVITRPGDTVPAASRKSSTILSLTALIAATVSELMNVCAGDAHRLGDQLLLTCQDVD